MNTNVIEDKTKKRTKKDIFCEKIGFFLFRITKKFNDMSTSCLYKSSAKYSIEEAKKNLDKKEDIGEKVMAYSDGIADVISEPVETLKRMENEVIDCHDFVSTLYDAWVMNDDDELEKLFLQAGFYKRIGS